MGDYIDILSTSHVKRLHVNYDNLFMFQSQPRALMQVFRTGSKINEQTLRLLIHVGFFSKTGSDTLRSVLIYRKEQESRKKMS